MKRCAVILLTVVSILAFTTSAWAFDDTAGLNKTQQTALQALFDMGVVNGYPDNTFRPASTVTRAEFSKMVCIFAGQKELTSVVCPFSDIKAADWFYGWVCRATDYGLVIGYEGGTFRPQNTVTQQEIITVLVRLAGLEKTDFIWPASYIEAARAAGAFKDLSFSGAEAASRIITCQLLYNMLEEQETEEPQPPVSSNITVKGIIAELGEGSVTIKDGKGVSTTYTAKANLLPASLIVGSYLELTVNGNAAVQVVENISPKKGVYHWDIALDGSSATIDGKNYKLKDADIFVAEYTLNKPYSTETYIKGGPIDRDMLSMGGRLAAEMAVILDDEGGSLLTAYLVNVSLILSGGRLDVVEGFSTGSQGKSINLLGRDASLPIEETLSLPQQGQFIYYTISKGVVKEYQLMLDIEGDYISPTKDILNSSNATNPYAWVGEDGSPNQEPGALSDVLAEVMYVGNGGRTLQLGTGGINYWLIDGCLIYEVKSNFKISQGSRGSISKGQTVIALVNKEGEICYIFCFMD